jgi:hypothetical protein
MATGTYLSQAMEISTSPRRERLLSRRALDASNIPTMLFRAYAGERRVKNGEEIMFGLFELWVDATDFGLQTQHVIAMRLMKIAGGGRAGLAESGRMFAEKFDAVIAAHRAGAIALVGGKSIAVATQLALAPVKRRVSANYRRLSRDWVLYPHNSLKNFGDRDSL